MKTKIKPNPALARWLDAATDGELRKLALLSGSSYHYLRYLLAPGHRCVSSEFAARLEEAAAILRAANPELPPLVRVELSDTCAQCPLAAGCRGGK